MLYQSDIVDAVRKYLEVKGYKIDETATTTSKGYDLIAVLENGGTPIKLVLKARGATSAHIGSKKYGKPFDRSQVAIHVAEVFYKAAEALSMKNCSYQTCAAMALPKNKDHEDYVLKIRPTLSKLGVVVFFVDENRKVEVMPPPNNDNILQELKCQGKL